MLARTLKQVNNSIQKEIGNFTLVKGEGYFYIYSEDYELDLKLKSLYTTSIYVCHLNHQSIKDWLEDVKYIVSKIKQQNT